MQDSRQCASIVLYGQDARLVETRCWVLEASGFKVRTVLTIPDLLKAAKEQLVGLFLLCDSLPPEARAAALAAIHPLWPGAKRLVLAPASHSAEITPTEEVFLAMEGPKMLIRAIRTLIVNGPAAAA